MAIGDVISLLLLVCAVVSVVLQFRPPGPWADTSTAGAIRDAENRLNDRMDRAALRSRWSTAALGASLILFAVVHLFGHDDPHRHVEIDDLEKRIERLEENPVVDTVRIEVDTVRIETGAGHSEGHHPK